MSKPPSISGRDSNTPKVDGTDSSAESQKPDVPEQKPSPKQNPSGVLANLRPASEGPLGKRSLAGAASPPAKRTRNAIVRPGDLGGASAPTDPAPVAGAPQPATTEGSARRDDIHETAKKAVRALVSKALKDARLDDLDGPLLEFVSQDEYRDLADAAIDTKDEAKRGARLARLGGRLADLTEPQRERFVDAVVGLNNESTRATALASLGVSMKSLSELRPQQDRLVDSAIGIKDEREKALALAGLGVGIAHLTEPQRKRFVAAAAGIENERYRALAMAGMGAGMAGMTNLSETRS